MERRLFKSVVGIRLPNSALAVALVQGRNPSLFESGLALTVTHIMTVTLMLVSISSKRD